MATGIIKFFNQEKGFGFIIPDDRSGDVFFHVSVVQSPHPLRGGQKVSYEIRQDSPNGQHTAKNVIPE